MTTATEPAPPVDLTGFNIRLSARMPDGDANGLRDWARLLVQHPRVRRYAVVEFDTARVIDDVDKDTDTAVIRMLRVEVVEEAEALAMMLAAANRRGVESLFGGDDGETEQ